MRTRIALLLTPWALLASKPPPPCTDYLRLNDFARRYNDYVEALRNGIIDLRLWRRVCDRARDLFPSC